MFKIFRAGITEALRPIEKEKAEEKEEKKEFICDVCGFKAKNLFGLMAHKRKHK